MSAAIAGPAEFEAFYNDHYAAVVRSLTVAIRDRSRAEDVAQDAFTKAFHRWPRVSRMQKPLGWVFVTALRRARRDLLRETNAPALERQPAIDHAGRVVTAVSVREAIDLLPSRQRAAVVLRYMADLTVDDIATVMGCRPGTVKATLHAALASLQLKVPQEDEQ